MNKYIEKFLNLKTGQKIEFITAGIITVGLIVGLPIYAWFSYSNSIETMTKIKEPENLDIRAGNYDSIINFDLRDVNIEAMKNHDQMACYVFSVNSGDYKIKYNLQLAHTTNIPFKYSLWRATRIDYSNPSGTSGTSGTSGSSGSGEELDRSSILVPNSGTGSIVYYHPLYDTSEITSYRMDDEIELEMLNPEYGLDIGSGSGSGSYYGRTIAKQSGTYYDLTYSGTGSGADEAEIYAVPLYLQTREPITPSAKGIDAFDYFILKLEWDETEDDNSNFSKWNKAENNKETDIIYITASKSTG